MSRYCSISHYKKYLSSLNSIKDSYCNNLKEIELLPKSSKHCRSQGLINRVFSNISRIGSRLHNASPITSAVSKIDAEEKSATPKYVRRKVFRKEVQKLYLNLQRQISNQKHVLWTAAGVTAVDTALPKTETKPEATTSSDALIDPIPEAPPIPETIEVGGGEILNQLNALGEPTFASLGLGGKSPIGIAQNCFEYLHVNLGLEWWAAIVLGTVVIRVCMFPLVIIAQRNAAKMNNYMPQLQILQMKMTEARQQGNVIDTARYSQEQMLFMKEKGVNPFKNMLVPLAQMPIFISFFMALRQMANCPVDSLKTGGMLWFSDLTMPDQFFLLPLITSTTLWITIEVGTDSAKLSAQNAVIMKYVLRALPIAIFPFTMNFPGAILCYWVSSNFISLIQVGILRIPAVRDYFNIEAMKQIDTSKLPLKKGFKEGVKDAWTNVKISHELESRRKADELTFQRAGKGPMVKTFKYDPTKQASPTSAAPISAKKR